MGVLPEMTRTGKKRRHGGKQTVTDRWQRWQLAATVIRIVVDLLDRFAGAGPDASSRGDAQDPFTAPLALVLLKGRVRGAHLYASDQ